MGAWVWFVISAVAAVAGVVLLLMDRGQRSAQSRERRRWAALRGWQFAAEDPVLPDRWRHGALARGGSGVARDLVSGSLFTAAGRRLVHVFDYEQGGKVDAVVAAVHRRTPQPVVLELWLPTVEFPTDAGLDLLGPVGDRYAFTSDLVKARPLITPELVALADDVGDDVTVMWIEDAWVAAAAAAPGTLPSRLERLLRLLGDLADLVDGVHGDSPRPSHAAAPTSTPHREASSSHHETSSSHHEASGSHDEASAAHHEASGSRREASGSHREASGSHHGASGSHHGASGSHHGADDEVVEAEIVDAEPGADDARRTPARGRMPARPEADADLDEPADAGVDVDAPAREARHDR